MEEPMTDLTMYPHPGKFEGELALAELAYDATMCGDGEEYDFGGDGYIDHYTVVTGSLEVTDEDKQNLDLTDEDKAFAENLIGFIVHENDSGFVSVSWYEKGEETKMAKAVGKLDMAMGEFERENGDD